MSDNKTLQRQLDEANLEIHNLRHQIAEYEGRGIKLQSKHFIKNIARYFKKKVKSYFSDKPESYIYKNSADLVRLNGKEDMPHLLRIIKRSDQLNLSGSSPQNKTVKVLTYKYLSYIYRTGRDISKFLIKGLR